MFQVHTWAFSTLVPLGVVICILTATAKIKLLTYNWRYTFYINGAIKPYKHSKYILLNNS